jgi:hypothetical protein
MNPTAIQATEPADDQNLFVPGAIDKASLAASNDFKRTATARTEVLLRAPHGKPVFSRASQSAHILLK